jgi:hypothetical protein
LFAAAIAAASSTLGGSGGGLSDQAGSQLALGQMLGAGAERGHVQQQPHGGHLLSGRPADGQRQKVPTKTI